MEDNEQSKEEKVEPVEAEIVSDKPPFAGEEKEDEVVNAGHKKKLDSLPPEILEEIKTELLMGKSANAIRKEMIEKYPAVDALKANINAWYKKSYEIKGVWPEGHPGNEKAIKQALADSMPTTEDLKRAVSLVVNPSISLERKQEAMSSLFDKAIGRMSLLEEKNKNYMNPEYEALIITYMKTASDLIDKVAKLQDTLNQDVLKQFESDLSEYTRVILSTVYNSYRAVHPGENNKIDEFRINVEEHLKQTLKAYHQNTPEN